LVFTTHRLLTYLSVSPFATQIRWTDLGVLLAGSALWCVIAKWVLEQTGSALPGVVMKRLKRS
jgi:hypothetical protein